MWLIEWLTAVAAAWSAFWADAVTPPPGWAADGAGYIATTVATASSLCSFMPLELFGPLVVSVFAFWAVGFALRVGLMAASAVTPGGLV